MKELDNRNVVVTGASRGLGVAIARALATRGANLVLIARSAAPLEALATELRALGVKAVALAADLEDTSSYPALIARAESALGPIDVLINNAALEANSLYAEYPAEQIERMLRVDLTAPMLLTRALLPGMLQRGRGHIVNIASLAGKSGTPYDVTYAAAKGGLVLFSESLRAELRGTGVSSSAVCPGFIADAGMFANKELAHGVRPNALVGTSRPAQVADAVVRAIQEDKQELFVSPGPMRLLHALNQLLPGLLAWLSRRLGVTALFKQVADGERALRGLEDPSSPTAAMQPRVSD